MVMHLIAQVKLLPSNGLDKGQLHLTLHTMNVAANEVSSAAWEHRVFSRVGLQRLCYRVIRERYRLSAQATIHVTRKVADAYKKDKRTERHFREDGAVTFDDRILSWKLDSGTVSIWTLAGRLAVPFAAGEASLKLLALRKGESDLVFRDGNFYLLATCVEDEPEAHFSGKVLGVDRGIANIATTSNGANYTGKHVNRVRHRNDALRAKLQAKNTKSTKRLLKKRRRKESRFSTDTNHKISYRIVREAQRTGSAIALENLSGICDRTRVRKPQRRRHHSWSYDQLGQFIEYKAKRLGVPVVYVNPAHTSQHCPACGHVSRKNRPTRDLFSCQICGLAGPSDMVASVNIASLGKDVLVRKTEYDNRLKSELGRGEVTHPGAALQTDQPDWLSIGLVPSGTVELLRPEDLSVALAASSVL